MTIAWVVKKSSAVSVCSFVGLAGTERVAIFPSGSPVAKVNTAAEAWPARTSEVSTPRAIGWKQNLVFMI
jgi:hypothetical protein